ncbi:bifunctional tRNA (5-methylaminomethyl-2-thiouridine)(34)-methyltransferase MnmD/FAD-dependent 5-carboxymethylaminomethyl-2-thiouridine(34) oxidoreductase MnmC [Marinobacter fuscus]|uniref:tRNA 5-methylaminomethyl-2-thiouridine biosynthesis bifunctional protein MnmC n=1 Tax=Marinobacter fuscus TaxID=2109942 RepID=A0A2T1K644_9GAMM|nr:bifunctional tRNA (5-methylaminomethyl-2-thiouridine)(34)-methyltransferase MnmD/FAD-dependent 5-carboxymethylaminomethyl-2-thiouridine(34) oxidoreductase MnmC [Marinobacter fuscus]PSF05619.1 bifunctional tRNA (5-methylaminomethyl-2-thiouridine)(34)-methyltransferase MnmD/FAD-dependent 5-carboxymethylaminomethyl-2-thiouridine(34) oxidoreductase MnmC [Marinobacter fuscus]
MPPNSQPPAMTPAELTWHDGVPESTRFGDVYFSRDDGLAETRYVFIERNRLPERFQALGQNEHFVIAETGFGTGLNFLATWAEWRAQRADKAPAKLHFVSVERYPLTHADLEQALSYWPELAPLAQELLDQYPPLIQGTHRLLLEGGAIRLTLYFGDILDAWKHLEFVADAWFLDGFAPALNPDMWLETAIQQVRQHSRPGTTLATFTAVGRIRRALADAGFAMAKVTGFGRKRDMLTGELPVEPANTAIQAPAGSVVILGAGIAGTTLARNLAERGVPVMLVDAAESPGRAASGNPQGALYVKLGIEFNDQTELATTALTFSQRFYKRWQGEFWHPTGLLQLATSEAEINRQQRFLGRNRYPAEVLQPVTAEEASRIAGLPLAHDGLWFPRSGWLKPGRACSVLADHPLIRQVFGFEAISLERRQHGWVVRSTAGEQVTGEQVVIAAGHKSGALVPVPDGYKLNLKPIRGQVSEIPAQATSLPEVVICGHKYVNPVDHGSGVTGATFDLRDDNPEPTLEGHRENLTELAAMVPGVGPVDDSLLSTLTGRVAFRCSTHDYQPVAGAYQAPGGQRGDGDGLYLFTGLGSKGLVWAPLLAEFLGDLLCGQPRCLPRNISKRIATGRLHRQFVTESR